MDTCVACVYEPLYALTCAAGEKVIEFGRGKFTAGGCGFRVQRCVEHGAQGEVEAAMAKHQREAHGQPG
jgi:hypothetical protein